MPEERHDGNQHDDADKQGWGKRGQILHPTIPSTGSHAVCLRRNRLWQAAVIRGSTARSQLQLRLCQPSPDQAGSQFSRNELHGKTPGVGQQQIVTAVPSIPAAGADILRHKHEGVKAFLRC